MKKSAASRLECLLPAFALAVLLSCRSAAAQQKPDARFQAVAARLAAAIDAGRYADAADDFNDAMRAYLPPGKAAKFFKVVRGEWGKILKLDAPTLSSPDTAVFTAHCEEGTFALTISLDSRGRIGGLLIKPGPSHLPVPRRNEVPLSLPFRGRWSVFWGGDTEELNHHHNIRNQRFAFDFAVADDAGSTHKGDGKKNEDYYDYGREIVAPGDGFVVRVIDGIPENVPGVMNPEHVLGNAVFIQHAEREVSILAHLIPGSIRVKEGQRVRQGQIIGLCGNSGNSSEPHLHYHLQNTPVFWDGTGIKVFFSRVVLTSGGRTTAKRDYSPVKGDLVSP